MDLRLQKEAFRVFSEALEIADSDRDAYLDHACGSNTELQREVKALLNVARDAQGYIETPLLPLRLQDAQEFRKGERVGRYKIERLIEHGGMAAVYEATHPELGNPVAVKIVRPDSFTKTNIDRFLRERSFLAKLDHPNIAKSLDAGTTESGVPYLVMEFIDGLPIDNYCASRGLRTKERIQLFERVCSAVHFAHQNLIVHRDLKPSNILVTPEGEPKLLDFGVALLLDSGSYSTNSKGSWSRTAISFLGTLRYASPEQIRSEPLVSTATDIYSLGIILYEILAGHHPFEKRSDSFLELQEAIGEGRPAKPSRMVLSTSPANFPEYSQKCKLARELLGDLDCIVLKALRKEPSDRYASARDFAEDLNRHLNSLPVSAREPSLLYHGVKFARRYPAAPIFAALFLVLSIVLFGLWKQEQRFSESVKRSEGRMREANQQLERSWFVRDFLANSLFAIDDPMRGEEITVEELLDESIDYLNRFKWLDDLPDEEKIRLQDQLPEDLAGLMDAFGWAYYGLGIYNKAEHWLEQSLALRRAEVAEDEKRIDGDFVLGLLHLSALRNSLAKKDEAVELREEALTVVRHGDIDTKRLAQSLNELGVYLSDRGDLRTALDLQRESLSMKRRLSTLPGHGTMAAAIANGLGNLGAAWQRIGEYAEAAEIHREALELKIELYGADTESVAATQLNLATSLRDRSAFDFAARETLWSEAEELFRVALTTLESLYGEEHRLVAIALNNLAGLLQIRGTADGTESSDLKEAGRLYDQALGILGRLEGESSSLVGTVLRNKATWFQAIRDSENAELTARRSLEILDESLGPQHWLVATAESVLGGCLVDLGRLEEAEPLLRSSLEVIEKEKGKRSREALEARQRLERFDSQQPS